MKFVQKCQTRRRKKKMINIIIFVIACMAVTIAVVIASMKKSFDEKIDILEHEIESQEETIKFLTDLVAKVDDRVNKLNDETVEKVNELITNSNAQHYNYEDLSENFVNMHNAIFYDISKRLLYLEKQVNGGENKDGGYTSTPCN